MIGLIGRYSAFVAELSLVSRCALSTTAVAFVVLPAAVIAWSNGGAASLEAALFAAALCWVAGTAALLLAHRGRGTPASVGFVLAGDGVAMGLPLAVAVGLQRSAHPLHQAGFFKWVVLFFLATLAARTLLVAPFVNAAARPARRAPKTEAGV